MVVNVLEWFIKAWLGFMVKLKVTKLTSKDFVMLILLLIWSKEDPWLVMFLSLEGMLGVRSQPCNIL